MSQNNPPEPPNAPEELMAVGNTCEKCGTEQGLFFCDGSLCRFCYPEEQPNGRVIQAITYSPPGTIEERRLPNTALRVDEDNTVTLLKGEHSDVFWTNGKPTVQTDSDVAQFMIRTSVAPPATYSIYFKQ